MSDMPRRKAPASARILEAWLQRHAETTGVPGTRMRRGDVEVEELPSIVDFTIFGLDENLTEIPVLGTSTQIAQKFHACTEVFEFGPNKRVRDVPDILLLATLIHDMRQVRERCEAIFTARDKHSWPPETTIYDSWRAGYPDLIAELDHFPYPDLDSAVDAMRTLIREIGQSGPP